MSTAHLVILFGQSNDNGYGMSTTGLQTSYQGHDISNVSDSLYTGSVKIWDTASSAYVNLSQSTYTSPSNGIGLGPQLYVGAHMLARWASGDCFIVKRSYDGSGLAYNSGGGSYDWAVEGYNDGTSLLKNLLDDVKNGIDYLIGTLGYTDVAIEAIFMTQGEEDSTDVTYAYNYGWHLQNLVARVFERLNFTTGSTPYFGWVQPFIPRDTTVAGALQYVPEYGYMVRECAQKTITYLKGVHGSTKSDVINTSAIYASGDILSGDDRHWTNQGQGKKVDAMFAAYDAAVTAGYTAPTKSSGWTENTTFDSLPSLSAGTTPNSSYNANTSISASVTGSNFDAGDSASNVTWYCNDDTSLNTTASSISWTPTKYNGLCIRAKYTNTKHYCSEVYFWTHVLAPRTTTALGTPKHWIRENTGVVQYNSTGRIARIDQYSGANTAYAWQPINSAGSTGQHCWAHHLGIGLIIDHYARCLPWDGSAFSTTTTDQTNASLTDTGNWTRIAKFRPRIACDSTNTTVYGVRGVTTAGGNISIGPTIGAGASETAIPIVGRRARTTLCPSSGFVDPVTNAGDTVIAAFKKNGTSFSLHVWNGSGVDIYTNTYSGMTEGYPDTIGSSSNVSMSGLIMEVIGVESAISDSDISTTLSELAANDVPTPTVLTPSNGSITLSGQTPTLTVGDNLFLSPSVGSASFVGNTPTLIAENNISITPVVANITISGQTPTVNIENNFSLTPSNGSVSISGNTPTISVGNSIPLTPSNGTVSLFGNTPLVDIQNNIYLSPVNGSITISGNTPILSLGNNIEIIPSNGATTVLGNTPTINIGNNVYLFPTVGSVVVSGNTPTLTVGDNVDLNPTSGSATVTGNTPTLSVSDNIYLFPTNGTVQTIGNTPILTTGDSFVLAPSPSAISVSGNTPSVTTTNNIYLFPSVGGVPYQGGTPVLSQTGDVVLSPSTGSVSYTGNVVTLSIPITLTPTSGNIVINGNTPVVSQRPSTPTIIKYVDLQFIYRKYKYIDLQFTYRK